MRLYEWVVATEAAGRWKQSPVGVTDDWQRAEARMLESLSGVPGGVRARGWVTTLAFGTDRVTYDRLETPVQVVRDTAGGVRPVAGDMVGDRLRARLEAQPCLTPIDGRLLRDLRTERGMSQEQLAEKAGLGLTTVSRLERHPLPLCHFRTRSRIAKALGAHPYAITAVISPELAGPPAGAVRRRPRPASGLTAVSAPEAAPPDGS